MFSIITLITTLVMCLYRGFLFFTQYDPSSNLFERTFLSFTLPNIITIVYVLMICFGIYKAAQIPNTQPNKFCRQISSTLSLASSVLFLVSALLYGALKFVITAQVSVPDLIICLLLVALAFYCITLSSYQNRKAEGQTMGIFSMVCSLLVVFLIVCSFVSTTEMNVLENYMYYLLLLCATSLYFLYLSRNFLSNGNSKVSGLYGQLVVYFAAMQYLPKGIYLMMHNGFDFIEGFLSVLVGVSIVIFVLSVKNLIYYKKE